MNRRRTTGLDHQSQPSSANRQAVVPPHARQRSPAGLRTVAIAAELHLCLLTRFDQLQPRLVTAQSSEAAGPLTSGMPRGVLMLSSKYPSKAVAVARVSPNLTQVLDDAERAEGEVKTIQNAPGVTRYVKKTNNHDKSETNKTAMAKTPPR
jgi:hypothetical protein